MTSTTMVTFIAAAFVVIATMAVPIEAFSGQLNASVLRQSSVSVSRNAGLSRCRVDWKNLLAHLGGGGDEYDEVGNANANVKLADDENVPDEDGGVVTNLMKETTDLVVGDWVVAKRDVPSLGIRAGVVYKLLAIFLKGAANSEGLGVEVIPLERYGDDNNNKRGSYTKYLRVYNPRDHDKMVSPEKGVLVTPEEIGLVSVKAEWTEALFLAVPGFFWVFVAISFSNYYTDRYGGTFLDAFFRT